MRMMRPRHLAGLLTASSSSQSQRPREGRGQASHCVERISTALMLFGTFLSLPPHLLTAAMPCIALKSLLLSTIWLLLAQQSKAIAIPRAADTLFSPRDPILGARQLLTESDPTCPASTAPWVFAHFKVGYVLPVNKHGLRSELASP